MMSLIGDTPTKTALSAETAKPCIAATIGIVVAIYNREDLLEATLRHVQDQTFGDWHCVCVDDGSKDGSVAIVERVMQEDPRFTLVRQQNAGASVARNNGFAHLHPETRYVNFLDSDDLLTPNALRSLHDALEKHPGAGAVHGLAEMIDQSGQPHFPGYFSGRGRSRFSWRQGRLVALTSSEPTDFASIAYNSDIFPPAVVLVRRETLNRVGLFDPTIVMIEDWDLWLRVSRLSSIHFLDEVVTMYRVHLNNLTAAALNNRKALAYLTNKALFCPKNTPEQLTYVRWGYRAQQIVRVKEKLRQLRNQWRRSPNTSIRLLTQIVGHLVRWALGRPPLAF